MLKSTAAFIGFLFGLSTAYYLSYWSFFNINAFQYIAVEDIIKGIAYPLRFGGAWIIGAIFFVISLYTVSILADTSRNAIPKRGKWLLASFIAFTIASAAAYVKYADNTLLGMIFSVIFSLLLMVIYANIDAEHNQTSNASSEHPLLTASNAIAVYAAIFLSINAIVSGQVEARGIHSGRRYNYILAQDLPKEKIKTKESYLIFLGAVSEKYIFIDKSENERFIIAKDELPDLQIHYFDSLDSASVTHFNRVTIRVKPVQRKPVTADSLLHPPAKRPRPKLSTLGT